MSLLQHLQGDHLTKIWASMGPISLWTFVESRFVLL
jgi:hypothetical protein